MSDAEKIYTVLKKTGKKPFWTSEEIGTLIGNITGDRNVYVQPEDSEGKAPGPAWLIIDGEIEEPFLSARLGHHRFSVSWCRIAKLPFDISQKRMR